MDRFNVIKACRIAGHSVPDDASEERLYHLLCGGSGAVCSWTLSVVPALIRMRDAASAQTLCGAGAHANDDVFRAIGEIYGGEDNTNAVSLRSILLWANDNACAWNMRALYALICARTVDIETIIWMVERGCEVDSTIYAHLLARKPGAADMLYYATRFFDLGVEPTKPTIHLAALQGHIEVIKFFFSRGFANLWSEKSDSMCKYASAYLAIRAEIQLLVEQHSHAKTSVSVGTQTDELADEHTRAALVDIMLSFNTSMSEMTNDIAQLRAKAETEKEELLSATWVAVSNSAVDEDDWCDTSLNQE